MKRIGIATLIALAALAAPAGAAVTFEYVLSDGYGISISHDGQAIAGNTPSYSPFRWTQAGGMVLLGMDPTPSPGGTPGISADGLKVASTIISSDSTYSTAGLWTQGTGWTQLMPPGTPSDAWIMDRNDFTVYDLSGDGQTVVGLYWRTQGRGHAFKWTQAGGGVDLGSSADSNACRANAVNYDGSVICGWDEAWFGNWRPAVWYNGVQTVFDGINGDGQCAGSNTDGTIVVGFARNSATDTRECARWTRTGSTWSATEYLGSVPGTAQTYGVNYSHGVTDDGSMIVGYCSFDGSPFWTTGFVWTQATGTVDVVQWLADHGVAVDPSFGIQSLSDISPDGQWIIGYGRDLVAPYTRRTFRIHNTEVASVPVAAHESGLALEAPRPNPSAGPLSLAFTLPVAGGAELSIYDAAGRRVATPLNRVMPAGPHAVTWNGRADDGRPVANGMYWARLSTTQGAVTCRLVRIQ